MSIKVKFRDDETIRRAADEFRNSPLLSGFEIPPIDVIYIAEVILKLDVIPLPNLFSEQHKDAALLADLTGIYVDEDAYLAWENKEGWVEKRLRFSFAHELAHYILHRDEIIAGRPTSETEFILWEAGQNNYTSAEYQADEFAGRFLVPLDILKYEFNAQCQKLDNSGIAWREIEGMREYVAKQIAPRFGVNHQVIEVRFDREGIWRAR
jgi:Zn-dependent peptidase ImmA (M78 family)